METKNLMGVLIIFFITVIIGLVMFQVTADNVATISSTPTVVNESVASVYLGIPETLANDDLVSFSALYNTTGELIPATNYTVNLATGVLTLTSNAIAVNNTALKANYVYYANTYVKDNTSRSLVALITTLFAIGLLLVGVYYVFKKMYGDVM
jgi:hypothetical protein